MGIKYEWSINFHSLVLWLRLQGMRQHLLWSICTKPRLSCSRLGLWPIEWNWLRKKWSAVHVSEYLLPFWSYLRHTCLKYFFNARKRLFWRGVGLLDTGAYASVTVIFFSSMELAWRTLVFFQISQNYNIQIPYSLLQQTVWSQEWDPHHRILCPLCFELELQMKR